MTIEELQSICQNLPNVTQDIKWETHLCFNINGKMFLVTSPDDVPVSASFKTGDEAFINLTERPGIMPAPYLARHKWVHVDDINRISKKEWMQFINESYTLISAKASKKKKQ